jgi:hypothetical protein
MPRSAWIITAALFFVSTFSLGGFSKEIDPAHRECKADSDCQVLMLACACIYNATCARPEDRSAGIVDSVNRQYAAEYWELSKCTPTQLKVCATAGDCIKLGTWAARCENLKCLAVFKSKYD